MLLILLTNDDGIEAEGLQLLEESIRGLANVVVVAPDCERSAVSHGLTLHARLKLNETAQDHYTLDGTPADCVIYALRYVLQRPPDLIIAGINHGANLGDDIIYSGTVAAAREASRHGIPSLAVSQAYAEATIHFGEGARFTRLLAEMVLKQKYNGGICLNVNIPVRRILGVKITRQACTPHFPHLNTLDCKEPRSWFTEDADLKMKSEIPLDFEAILDNYVSITPLKRDQTDYASLPSLLELVSGIDPGQDGSEWG